MTAQQTCAVCGSLLDQNASGICSQCLARENSEDSTLVRPHEELPTIPPTGARNELSPTAELHQGDSDQRFGGYQILSEISKWEFGTVYDAYHPGLDRHVTLRVLEKSSAASDDTRAAFLSRVKVLSRINHPHVATTLAAGVEQGDIYVVEEKFDGQQIHGFGPRSFKQRIREGFFPGQRLYRIMRDAALGLQAIHQSEWTHGNIDAESLLLDSNGLVRIAGIHKIPPAELQPQPLDGLNDLAVQVDLQQLGQTFMTLASGPDHHWPVEKLKSVNPGLRTEFCQIIERCVNTDRPGSYTSAQQVADDLNTLQEKRVRRARWRPRIFSQVLGWFAIGIYWGSLTPTNRLMDFALIGLFLLPFVYIIAMETVVGWTLFRRLFGMRLYDVAGQTASRPRRFARATIKTAIFAGSYVLPACLLPIIAAAGGTIAVFGGLLILFMFAPVFILYFPSFWIRSRWTYYDLLTGVTWAEEVHTQTGSSTSQDSIEQKISRPTDPAPTHQVDQYDIFENLGAGGMGSVFRARDRTLQRDIAIKVLASHLSNDPELLHRFEREARLAANISHPNVAKVFGNGIWNDAPYIAMEMVDGNDLKASVEKNGPIPIAIAWKYIIQAATGLRAADQLGVVHRDIKPANLMIASHHQLKIMDFGISCQTTSDIELTRAGDILGTPVYMSPEQAKGKEVDRRSDIYSLGMTLYFLLSGRQPFTGKNPMQILAQQISDDPDPLTGQVDGLTPDQEKILARMIAKDPHDRYQDYDSLLIDLGQASPGLDRLAQPVKRIAAVICTFAGILILFVIAFAGTGLVLASQGEVSGRVLSLVTSTTSLVIVMAIAAVFVIGVGFNGMTPGKKLLRLRVRKANGNRATYKQALVRFLVQYPVFLGTLVSAIAGFTPYVLDPAVWGIISNILLGFNSLLLLISTVMLWKHPQRRTLHDLAAGTIVESIDD